MCVRDVTLKMPAKESLPSENELRASDVHWTGNKLREGQGGKVNPYKINSLLPHYSNDSNIGVYAELFKMQ